MIRYILCIVLIAVLTPLYAMDCGNLENHYGPFDYRDAYNRADKLPIVEAAHFSEVTYALALRAASNKEYFRKFTTGNKQKNTAIPNDIDYALRAFPNHPKALYAMSEYQRLAGPPSGHESYPAAGYRKAECYYIRALAFVPDDAMVTMLYGVHFHKRKQYEKALDKYLESETLDPENIETKYNIGLLYHDMGDKAKAKLYAIKVYKSGYPLQGLARLVGLKPADLKDN